MSKHKLEKDQIVKVKYPDSDEKHIAIVTKILGGEYVSCIQPDGTVHPAVFTGYIDPCDGTKLMLSEMLEQLKKLDK